MSQPNPEKFIKALRSYLGVKYRHQGRSQFGVDCLGLIICALRDCGVDVVDDSPDYSHQVDPTALLNGIYSRTDRMWIESDRTNPIIIPSALLIFRITKDPRHLGIATSDRSMIHASRGACNEVIEHPLDDWWQKRITEVRWIKSITQS